MNQNIPNKAGKGKRSSINRPHSTLDSDIYWGCRSDIENETVSPAYRNRLHNLFRQIEREFDLLYQENQHLHEKVDLLNEKIEREPFDKPNFDCVDFDNNFSKIISKKLSSTSSQKLKTAYKLKAQTSKIVSSFKTPNLNCSLVKEFTGHKDGVWEVSVARPGQPIIGTSSADHTACVWSIETGRCLLQYHGHSGSVNSIRFHPGKDLVLTASGDCTAHIWQAAVNWDIPKGHSSEEELEGEELDLEHTDRSATLRTPVCELTGHTGAISAADWLPGAEQVITAAWDRLAIVHDVETKQALTTLAGHDLELTHTATHVSQKLAVTSSRDTTFRLWDFRDAVHSVSVFQGHTESVTSAVFTRDERVVSGSDDRTVRVWDLRNMRSPTATIRADSAINRLAVSPVNNLIAIPHDNRQVRLFDLSGQRLARLPRSSRHGHSRMVAGVAWTQDDTSYNSASNCGGGSGGANLFTCGFDRRVLGWSVQSLKDL